ncbi:glycoside hydrolase family 3 N-terminal domain-containing protein [Prosthecomicrobium sp. N25]|uniref:glycoside hydrolase family 3 N-terminal domain-containing protein n=1 Tax=Prosthecomicrobium sp. N25 TaxID=3129254 RepID=UPI003077D8AE
MPKARAPQLSPALARLLARMSPEEKTGQLTMISIAGPPTGPVTDAPTLSGLARGEVGSVLNLVGRDRIEAVRRVAREESRLGIPIFTALDVVHGYRTVFPVPLGEAAAFDPDLWRATAAAAAGEAVRDGVDVTFAPMLDVCRDPRWGRIVEGAGEDPWVAARFARAKVEGFQGGGSGGRGLAATAKHFCAYGAVAAGRDYASADVSARTLEEVYLPPFRAAVEAGVAAIMPASVDIAGVPMTAHAGLIRDRLRGAWGFEGVVISDWTAIAELMAHGIAADEAEAAALALRAGVDIDMMSGIYRRGLPAALARGLVGAEDVDAAVARVLALKERLGLFDRAPHRIPPPQVDPRPLAREAAVRSAVLLRNRNHLLPLADGRTIALVGPFAGSGADAIGPWAGCGDPVEATTLAAALPDALPGSRILVSAGVDAVAPGRAGIEAAVEAARRADAVVLCLGEPAKFSGEATSRADPGLTGDQEALARAVLAVGRPTLLILTCGRPLIVPWLIEAVDAVLIGWFLGTEAGPALAELITGRREPTGRLPVTWPRHVGQIPIAFGARPTGRPFHPADPFTSRYVDLPNEPLFPFGAGTGYATLSLRGVSLSSDRIGPGQSVDVLAEVSNDGDREGTAVLFLFVRDVVAMPNRPLLELRGVARTIVAPGSTARIAFELRAEDLASLDETRPGPEPGRFEIRVGFDADRAGHRVAALDWVAEPIA